MSARCHASATVALALAAALTLPSASLAQGINLDDLAQHWVQSSEEQASNGLVQIFRPAGSRVFPPSRFRMAYKFARSGGCEFYYLSPDDAHEFRPCTWRLGANDQTLLQITTNGTTTTYRIVELSRTVLRLEALAGVPAQQADGAGPPGSVAASQPPSRRSPIAEE